MVEDSGVEIFGTLESVLIDADGKLYLIIDKKNKQALYELAKLLKGTFEGKEAYVRIARGLWNKKEK